MKVGMSTGILTLVSVLTVSAAGAAEVLLSGFEGDLSTTLGISWTTDRDYEFVAEGATEGTNAIALTHPPTWNTALFLDGGVMLDLVTGNDLFKVDVTMPDTATWRQVFLVMQGDGLGWSQHGFDVPVNATSTVTLDLNATGIKAAAKAGGGTWWQIFVILQGGDFEDPAAITSIVDNIRFESLGFAPDPFPVTAQSIENDSHILTWESREGDIYDVQSSGDLMAGAWGPAAGLTGIVGQAGSTTVTGSLAAAAAAYRVQWIAPLPLFFDDLESGAAGWSTGGNQGDSPFTVWELGTPTTGPGAAHSGTNAFATNLDADYSHNAAVYLRTPVIDLTSVSNATLQFTHWYEFEVFDSISYDFGYVNILDAAGNSLVDKWLTYDGTGNPYLPVRENLPAAAVGQPVMIEFLMTSDPPFADGVRAGWYLDDVGVYP